MLRLTVFLSVVLVGLGSLGFFAWRERTARLDLDRALEEARREGRLADRNLKAALDAVTASLIRAVDESFAAAPDVQALRRELLEHTGTLLAGLGDVTTKKPDLLRSVAETERRTADLERATGRSDRAARGYAKAADRLRALALEGKATASDRIALAECLHAQGALEVSAGRNLAAAAQWIEDATATLASVREPDEKRRIETLRGRYRTSRARIYFAAGDAAEAELRVGAAIDDLGRLSRKYADDEEIASSAVAALGLLSDILSATGRGEEADEFLGRAERLADTLCLRQPHRPKLRLLQLTVLSGRARKAAAVGDAEAEATERRKIVAARRTLVKDFPEYAPYRLPLAASLALFAKARVGAASNEARESAAEALELVRSATDPDFDLIRDDRGVKLEFGGALRALAEVLLKLRAREGAGDVEESALRRREALEVLEAAVDRGFIDRRGLEADAAFEPLRGEAAFQAILTGIKGSR